MDLHSTKMEYRLVCVNLSLIGTVTLAKMFIDIQVSLEKSILFYNMQKRD